MPYTDATLGTNYTIWDKDPATGYAVRVTGVGAPPTTASVFAPGCQYTDIGAYDMYINEGTTASPSWNSIADIGAGDIGTGAVTTAKIADGAVTAAKMRDTAEARTATADGLTTGLITSPTSAIKFVAVTSGSATDAITLPAASAALIGTVIYLTVGANGYELLTPASGNNTINQVDSDGTNQLDVAANTTVRCTCVSATGWIAETIAATTIAITAPDND